MKWLTAFSCYAADAILFKPKGRLDINAEDKSHLVYDTKYSSKTTYTATDTHTHTDTDIATDIATATATATATAQLNP